MTRLVVDDPLQNRQRFGFFLFVESEPSKRVPRFDEVVIQSERSAKRLLRLPRLIVEAVETPEAGDRLRVLRISPGRHELDRLVDTLLSHERPHLRCDGGAVPSVALQGGVVLLQGFLIHEGGFFRNAGGGV